MRAIVPSRVVKKFRESDQRCGNASRFRGGLDFGRAFTICLRKETTRRVSTHRIQAHAEREKSDAREVSVYALRRIQAHLL